MGFNLSRYTQVSIPISSDLDVYRSTGSVDRSRCRSTGPVDRRAQDMHTALPGGPVDRPGRPPESSALWKWPQSTGRELLLSVSRPRSIGRSTAGPTVRNLTVDRSTGRSTDRSFWLPTASFSSPINWGFWGLFYTRFSSGF